MKEITVKSLMSGKEIKFRYSYSEKMVETTAYADGFNISTGTKKRIEEKLEVLFNGKWINAIESDLQFCGKGIKKTCEEKGVEKFYYSQYKGDTYYFVLNNDDLAAIEKMIDEEKAENQDPEVTEYDEKKGKKEREEEIAKCKEIIEKAEHTAKKDGKLMTKDEAESWKKDYNDKFNEGDFGYVPAVITQEVYIAARNRLKELMEQ